MTNFSWKVNKTSSVSRARTGVINTPHGEINTPAFIFCGTKAALKSCSAEEAIRNNTQIILSNTYHLMLQPGSEIISNHGGLHKFMNWHGPMLTDSGGFQIFSLGYGSVADEIKGRNQMMIRNKSLLNISEEGALFKSYIDGSKHLLTPEKSIAIQRDIGADLILVFDECTPFHVEKSYTAESMRRSHRWSTRSLNSFELARKFKSTEGSAGSQSIYGIIQGGIFYDLRDESFQLVPQIEYALTDTLFLYLHGRVGGTLKSGKKDGRLFRKTDGFNGTEPLVGLTLVNYF